MVFSVFPPSSPDTTYNITLFFTIFLPISTLTPLVFFGFFFLLKKCRDGKTKLNAEATKSVDTFSIWNYDGRIAFEDIIEATEDFDIKYCIGTGGYGSVYKAQLSNDRVFALKKLHRSEFGELIFMKSFENEARVLSKIRHRNIVKLYGFCLHKKCMFLIYEYMSKGSLFCVLRYHNKAIKLDWSKRVNIVKSVAHALSYLHHSCTPSIVHRDISSNNVLLNQESNAFLADFGTAKFLHPDSSNRTLLAGTRGYIAPAVVLQNSILHVRLPSEGHGNMITAEGREDDMSDTAIVIHNCTIILTPDLAKKPDVKTYLGRPWKKFS
ncbi:hypothetical protein LWI29_004682 [Acer saccharum]|uniref:non-specific serine/threonine protein kinase n=1 Tax=Acer saccharum TaxID=4024 RepID=A0AA39S2G7_ACESA|nr:hypothetical protein LWI29_004682 [Acer saccharum]